MVLVGRFRCCTAIGCESAEEGKSGAFSDMVFDVAYDGKLVTETKRVMEKEYRLISKSSILLRDSISERCALSVKADSVQNDRIKQVESLNYATATRRDD